MRDEEEDIDEIERQVRERYARSTHIEYAEEAAEVEQQALLPSVKDPKLWMVKCAVGSFCSLLDLLLPYSSCKYANFTNMEFFSSDWAREGDSDLSNAKVH